MLNKPQIVQCLVIITALIILRLSIENCQVPNVQADPHRTTKSQAVAEVKYGTVGANNKTISTTLRGSSKQANVSAEELQDETTQDETTQNETAQDETAQDETTQDEQEVSDRPKLHYETTQDSKCKKMFEWSMIDSWQVYGSAEIDYEHLPQETLLKKSRMGGPSATGEISMRIKVNSENLGLTVVKAKEDGLNLWHRMVPEYSAWVALQIAQRKFNLKTDRTVFLLGCAQQSAPEWSKMGEVSCDKSIESQADVVITPPDDGLLWDLAWDLNFECHNSEMFKEFRSLFIDESKRQKPMGCFISRQERPFRKVVNIKETMEMMKEVFPRVRVIRLTSDYTTDETTDLLDDCRVLFGVHGAGHMNAMFARPGVAVVEMWGSSMPAYFRNINMLLGQHYEHIYGDRGKDMGSNFVVDLEEAKAALIRARDYALQWTEEHGGQWR